MSLRDWESTWADGNRPARAFALEALSAAAASAPRLDLTARAASPVSSSPGASFLAKNGLMSESSMSTRADIVLSVSIREACAYSPPEADAFHNSTSFPAKSR